MNIIKKWGISNYKIDALIGRRRVCGVSSTMADLEKSGRIQARHVAEAIQYRTLDRTYWQQ